MDASRSIPSDMPVCYACNRLSAGLLLPGKCQYMCNVEHVQLYCVVHNQGARTLGRPSAPPKRFAPRFSARHWAGPSPRRSAGLCGNAGHFGPSRPSLGSFHAGARPRQLRQSHRHRRQLTVSFGTLSAIPMMTWSFGCCILAKLLEIGLIDARS